jgi:RNA polymerase sigma-70 factor (TIGR02960 family)
VSPEEFQALVEPYRRELHLHCYRMLGSLTDADDLLQETLLAAWRGLPGFEGRASMRTWLYRIATNRCLNARRAAARRIPAEPTPPFDPPPPTARDEVTWLQPYPDVLLPADPAPGPEARYEMREAVQLAFVTALQRMPPRQAATLVLRDVLGFDGAEVAAMLGSSETAVKGVLQRARAALDRSPSRTPVGASGPPGPPGRFADVPRRFADAFTAGDIDRVVGLLTDDAWLSMPPAPHRYQGAAAIAGFLRASWTFRPDHRITLLPVAANAQPAFASYLDATPAGLIVLTLYGGRIAAVTRFHTTALYARFGAPAGLTTA